MPKADDDLFRGAKVAVGVLGVAAPELGSDAVEIESIDGVCVSVRLAELKPRVGLGARLPTLLGNAVEAAVCGVLIVGEFGSVGAG